MDLNVKNFATIAITLAITVLLFVTVFVPVIDDAQKTVGPEITYNNTPTVTHTPLKMWEGEDMIISYEPTTKSLTFGENTYTTEDFYGYQVVFASNGFGAVSAGGSLGSLGISSYALGGIPNSYGPAFTISITNGEYTFARNNDVVSGTLTWMVYLDPEGEYVSLRNVPSAYTNGKPNDQIILGSMYSAGENTTFYSYYNGELSVEEQYMAVSDVTFKNSLVDSTTDIYLTETTVNIGEDSFAPWYLVVPNTIEGHEASGANYALVGIIPLLILVGIVLGTVGSFIRNRD